MAYLRKGMVLGLLPFLLTLVSCGGRVPQAVTSQSQLRLEPRGGNVIPDAEAEGGQAAVLRRNSEEVYFDVGGAAGCYDVSVRSRAELYKGPPKLRLSSDGQQLGQQTVWSETYEDKAFGVLC